MQRHVFSVVVLVISVGQFFVFWSFVPAIGTSTWPGAPAGLIFSEVLAFLAFYVALEWLGSKSSPLPTHRPKKRRDEGIWQDAPIAVVDKSTIGKLLASRMRREPGLQVVVRGQDAAPEPFRLDELYDPEVDG
jgi:hypothetical protein